MMSLEVEPNFNYVSYDWFIWTCSCHLFILFNTSANIYKVYISIFPKHLKHLRMTKYSQKDRWHFSTKVGTATNTTTWSLMYVCFNEACIPINSNFKNQNQFVAFKCHKSHVLVRPKAREFHNKFDNPYYTVTSAVVRPSSDDMLYQSTHFLCKTNCQFSFLTNEIVLYR